MLEMDQVSRKIMGLPERKPTYSQAIQSLSRKIISRREVDIISRITLANKGQ